MRTELSRERDTAVAALPRRPLITLPLLTPFMLTLSAPFVLPLAAPARAQATEATLDGVWTASGHDAGEDRAADPAYEGSATLQMAGQSLLYTGDMDAMTYRGVGLFVAGTASLALHFMEEQTGRQGVAHFTLVDGALEGVWAFSDAPEDHGVERWVRSG